MNDLQLRPARREDIPLLGPIEIAADRRYIDAGYEGLPEGDTIPLDAAERGVDTGRITLALVGGVAVGWLFEGRIDGELCLGQVSVVPDHGRRGVGTALLVDFIARARARGEPSIVLNTQANFPWAMPWYARHGFQVIPVERWSPGLRAVTEAQQGGGLDWSHRVHMRLSL